MNLIIYVDYDLLMFFNENEGQIQKHSDIETKQYLYFFYDKFTNEIKNNLKYRFFCLEGKTDFYGDIFNNIEKQVTFSFKDESKTYSFFIDNILSKIKDTFSEVKIIYSTNFSEVVKVSFKKIAEAKFQNVSVLNSFAEYSIKSYLLKNIQTQEKTIFVVESFSDNLYISKAKIEQQQISVENQKVLNKTIYFPKRFALARKIAEDIFRIYRPQNVESDIDKNTEYIYLKINENFSEAVSKPKDFVVTSTKILGSDERYIVKIDPKELNVLSENFAKNVVSEIEKNIDDSSKIILVGDIFRDEILKTRIDSLKNDKIFMETVDILSSIDKEVVAEDEYSTMFLATETQEDNSEFSQTTSLELNLLTVGANVKLTNYDSRPGKGYSSQLLEYVGENKFVVIESSRSLKAGDLVETKDGVWHPGIKLVLDVYRGGQKYGRFQTREIQTIETNEEKK